ncbi:hypothetical protein HPB47_007495 [Ixodes persulcatus]|uniref:Uncharacterized protein n=1 Tax=Ixodes persulcatus TaxID=34615 RepID=A0AC60P792_IXOPE|nr:hypothetical protein HPB47_007495 [Ixodes persulcatus]
MGVVSIHQFPIPEGKSGQQATELLQKRLETLGAVREGVFCVDCETYYSAPNISECSPVELQRLRSEQGGYVARFGLLGD